MKLTLRMAAVCVITISRGSLSGGKWLAETLASALGYRCIDRDTILNRASLCGVAYEELQEALVKAPSFLEHFSRKRYLYLTLIRSALLEELRDVERVALAVPGVSVLNVDELVPPLYV